MSSIRTGRWRRVALLGALVGLAVPLAAPSAVADHGSPEVELVVPVGPDGVTYRVPQGPDDGPLLGPPTLAVSPDGVMWIDDVYSDRLLRYAPDGTRLAPVDLAVRGVLAAMDIAVDADDLFVLDVSPEVGRYRVLRLTHDGRIQGTHDLPAGYHLEDGLSGIAVDGDGSVLVELEGGAHLVQLLDAAGRERLVERDGYRVHGRRYAVEYSPAHLGPVTVVVGDVRVEIDADHGNGAVQFLGATPDGDFFVSVEDVHLGVGPIRVDLTVHRYSAAGRFLAAARETSALRPPTSRTRSRCSASRCWSCPPRRTT